MKFVRRRVHKLYGTRKAMLPVHTPTIDASGIRETFGVEEFIEKLVQDARYPAVFITDSLLRSKARV